MRRRRVLEQGADDLRHDVFDCSIMKPVGMIFVHYTRRGGGALYN